MAYKGVLTLLRIAQIGTGSWGKNHTRILHELGLLCAICDSDKERRDKAALQYSVPGYENIDELIQSQEFDAAIVCTPTLTHVDVASTLIRAKKHTFVEKPLTYKSQDGQMLVDLAKKNNFLLQVVPTTKGSIIVFGWLDTNITGVSVGILFTC